MKKDMPKFTVIYSEKPLPEDVRAEKYISFLNTLVEIYKSNMNDKKKKGKRNGQLQPRI